VFEILNMVNFKSVVKLCGNSYMVCLDNQNEMLKTAMDMTPNTFSRTECMYKGMLITSLLI
jgi:hypothetical protein